ncbi:protein kinase [Nonomuraea sp. NPDC046570]|uniref:serine/threonine-protein kinase n=1 Tax=Nonomuraea sp. NPDC046570 TaxID=3155255 RepID=UPI0033E736D6
MQSGEQAPGYRVLDKAGEGGFGVVYRAYQERLDRIVALKVLSVDRVDQRTMRRFQRELRLTGRLTGHPNVVTVFDTGMTSSGRPYIAMEFFENGSLRDRVRAQGPLPLPDVLRAGVKLAGALAAVHEAGVLHGDIKPQNILISKYGEPAIADFGVARVVDSAEISASAYSFTPLHAAPEVLSGRPHSASTDIYSLGSTLYHLLAGQPAFHSPTDPSIAPLLFRVLSHEPPPITRPDVPPFVAEVVLRAMSKPPQHRYGSAREFAQRLREAQARLGLPVTDLVGEEAGGPDVSSSPTSEHTPHVRDLSPGAFPTPPAHSPPLAPSSPGQPFAEPSSPVLVHPSPGRTGASTSARDGGGSRLRARLVVGGAVAAVAVAGAVVAVALSGSGTSPQAQNTQAPKEPQAARTGEAIGEKTVASLAPRRLRAVSDRGSIVTLRWTLPAGARDYPLVLQREPADGQRLTTLESGATSAKVLGLKPGTGYCFLVGVPLRISEKSTVAWSKPHCVRGAVAEGAG